MGSKKIAVFLDRDGTINVSPKNQYVSSWKEFHFLPGSLRALKQLQKEGLLCILVSNQSGVGRGLFSRKNLTEIHRQMQKKILVNGGNLKAIYTCIHRPDRGCSCRKPKPGMVLKAARRFGIDLDRSFVIGDAASDIQMGKIAGCRTILVLTGKQKRSSIQKMTVQPDRIAKNLPEAVRWIVQHQRAA